MEFLDAVQQKITDTFSEDEAVLISALEKFLVFSSFLRDDSVCIHFIVSIQSLIDLKLFFSPLMLSAGFGEL